MTEERKPLSGREYYALRELFGIVSLFNANADELQKRVQMIPGGWRDLRLITAVSEKLMGNLLKTVPHNKLAMIQRELTHTVCEVKVNMDVSGRKSENFCYVPDGALVRTVKRLMGYECLFCEKCENDVKRCPIRTDFEALYPWDFPLKGTSCPLSGLTIGEDADAQDE